MVTATPTMFSTSPTKRRRTRGAFAMKPKKVTISWPENRLPVEIFILIISYLPRSNIQNMRLVNKEFEEKVSEYLFRVVVVPFKPEIYGITPEPTLSGAAVVGMNDMLQGAVMLQDKGMRVFQGFGRRIRKFAMSFEFDENKLSNPPVKSDQEAITSFWGIYRWPFKKYNRYSQLEGLEQTADETRTMAKALRFIECAKELGLSIDGGLGWLSGPDVNLKVLERGDKMSVFGESRFVPEPKIRSPVKGEKMCKPGSTPSLPASGDTAYASFERILQEAGYTGESLEPSVRMLLETEDIPGELSRSRLLQSIAANAPGWETFPRRAVARPPVAENISFATTDPGDVSPVEAYTLISDDDEDVGIQPVIASNKGKAKSENHSLKPSDLSNPQREMLLEIEWAQRAFMQSYAIAIIDNPKTFEHIEALTIARLPNRHLPILRREDFWESLPQLNKLSLAIIPDWREVTKLPTSWVQDTKLAPSRSISGVYQILNDQIARRPNIKTLHFEWICGGEEAPGLFSRNQHILAAPLVLKAVDMLNRKGDPAVLSLPFVEHFSLKNCWISPHIFTKFGQSCKKTHLQSLTLDSVSMTAPVPANALPTPVPGNGANAQNGNNLHHAVNHAAANNLLLNMQGLQGLAAQNAHAPLAPTPNIPAGPTGIVANYDWLEPPRSGSWASLVETFTPGTTLARQRYVRNESGPEPPAQNTGRLRRLDFKSCGYIRLPLDLDQTILDPPEAPAAQVSSITKKISDLESYMMKSSDPYLGVIINHIDASEAKALENGFLLTVGWDKLNLKRAILVSEALVDGVAHPGQGRFGGIIDKRHAGSSSR